MMSINFRKLRADEIDIRVAQISEKGASLLLYKDARCDMNILDEAVTPMGWMRQHSRDNANCTVSLWDAEKQMWISKEDTGTESNTEAEKGLASDSFKRACFNWGIGRELYTAPFIWIPAGKVSIVEGRNGKKATYDKFSVQSIEYAGNAICSLEIVNDKGAKVFIWSKGAHKQPVYDPKPDIARIKSTYGSDGFKQMRKILIAGKVVPDIPSDQMTPDDWKVLITAIDQNFGDAA